MKVDEDDDDFATTVRESHRVFKKYQMNVHHDEPFECGFQQVGLGRTNIIHCIHTCIPYIRPYMVKLGTFSFQ